MLSFDSLGSKDAGEQENMLMDASCSSNSKSKWKLMDSLCSSSKPNLKSMDSSLKGKAILNSNLLDSCSTKASSELMDLPNSILIDIFPKLPVKSLCCVESVSKTLYGIIRGDFRGPLLMSLLAASNDDETAALNVWLFVRAYTHVPPTERAQVLMTLQSLKYDGSEALHKSKYTFDFSQLLSTSDRYLKKVYRVHFVFRSYLIFLQHKHDRGRCFLVNCSSGVSLKLPTHFLETKYGPALHADHQKYEWYGMGFDSKTGTHKIVHVLRYGDFLKKVS